jgi:hypothetical protein
MHDRTRNSILLDDVISGFAPSVGLQGEDSEFWAWKAKMPYETRDRLLLVLGHGWNLGQDRPYS